MRKHCFRSTVGWIRRCENPDKKGRLCVLKKILVSVDLHNSKLLFEGQLYIECAWKLGAKLYVSFHLLMIFKELLLSIANTNSWYFYICSVFYICSIYFPYIWYTSLNVFFFGCQYSIRFLKELNTCLEIWCTLYNPFNLVGRFFPLIDGDIKWNAVKKLILSTCVVVIFEFDLV